LWDVTNPRRPVRIASVVDDQYVGAVAFSPDGRTLATTTSSTVVGGIVVGGGGGRLRLWDVTNPRRPVRIASVVDDQNVTAVAFSPDGRTLAATTVGGVDGRLRLWEVRRISALSGHVREWSCYAAGGGLSAAEWSDAVPGIQFQRSCP
jgi:WD40 repeat protein